MSTEILEDLEQLVEADEGLKSLNIVADEETHRLSCDDSPFTLDLKRTDFDTDKELERFIKSCERLIRSSPEYRVWTSYIRDSLGYYNCEVTGEQHAQTTVDIHHHPFSLYAIVKSVILKNMSIEKSFCSYDICEEVIKLHYEMKVPFCLLVSSLHEKFHNGFFLIPMELVKGDTTHLMNKYFIHLDEDEQQTITTRLAINKTNCGWTSYKWVENQNGHN